MSRKRPIPSTSPKYIPASPLAVADWLDVMVQFADYPGLPQLKHADYDIAAAYLGEVA